jgi:predicted RNA-binding Zn ribbon-like protein
LDWLLSVGGEVEASHVGPRPSPFFVGEHPALDFLNTVATPWDDRIEWLGNGLDLLAWLVRAELMPASAAERFRRTARKQDLDSVARRTRELREWFRDFVSAQAGRPLTPKAVRKLERVNRLLERGEVYRHLEPLPVPVNRPEGSPGPAAQWRWQRRWRTPEALLQPLAECIGDLACRADFRFVRRCGRCTLWFLDVSKGHRRRWCTMAICGNRAKAAAHRARASQ